MRSDRKPVEIFSFSFLDVIACAVGVILFITILVISQAAAKRDPALIEQLSEAQADIRTLETMQGEYVENQEKQKEKQQKTQQLAQLQAQANTLQQQTQLAIEYSAIKQQYEAAKDELDQIQAAAKQLSGRAPVARTTQKDPTISIAFQGNGIVRIISRKTSSYISDDYNVRKSRGDTILTSRGSGQELSHTMQPDGQLRKLISQMAPSSEFIECYIENDAFEDFVAFRNMMQTTSIDVGFIFVPDTSELQYSASGRSARVQ